MPIVSLRFLLGIGACLFGIANANAEQSEPRRIGVLVVGLSLDSQELQEFRQGLRDAGYSEGRDLIIEWRGANGEYDRVPKLAADLVQRKVEVIVVDGTVATSAAKRATSTIPIVMANVADPVGSGLVPNLAHPGANITGFTNMLAELSAKRLQLLKDTLPQASRVAVLWNPATPYSPKVIEELNLAARPLSIELKLISVRMPADIESAISTASRAHAQALYVVEDPIFTSHPAMVLKLVSKAKLPAVYGGKYWPKEGGLMSYGANYGDLFRRASGYVDKILKGTKPGDLPVEQPIKFELVVNVHTAHALGINLPESILLRADEVIR